MAFVTFGISKAIFNALRKYFIISASQLRAGACGLVGVLVDKTDKYRLEQDLDVEPERPVAHVEQVGIDTLLHLLERVGLATVAEHLRVACDAGLGQVP